MTVTGSYKTEDGSQYNLSFDGRNIDVNDSSDSSYDPTKFSQTFQISTAQQIFCAPGLASGGQLNVSVSFSTQAAVQVSASANQSGNGPATAFGPYLLGVPLQNIFTVTMDPSVTGISAVNYQFESNGTAIPGAGGKATSTSANQWSFTQNMGETSYNPGYPDPTLVANSLVISVTSRNASGTGSFTLASATDAIQELSTLNLNTDITVTTPGKGVTVDASQARFIRGINFSPTLTETISDLPSYYASQLTSIQLQTGQFGGSTISVHPQPATGGGVTFSFSTNVGGLTGSPSSSNAAVLNSIVTPIFGNVEGGFGTSIGNVVAFSGTGILQVISLPGWMGSSAVALANAEWSTDSNKYVINFVLPQNLSYSVYSNETPFGLFNNLETSYDAGIDVTVTANLTYGQGDAQAQANDLFATATILGQTVLQKSLIPGNNVTFTAPLDPLTLQPTQGITIAVAPFNIIPTNKVLFDVRFGFPSSNPTVPFKIPLPSGLSGALSVSGEFKGVVQYVTAALGVTLAYSNGQLTFGRGSFLQFNASATSTLQLNATAGIGFFNIINLVSGSITGAIGALINTQMNFDVSGPLLSPTISLDEAKSRAGAAVAFAFNGSVSLANGLVTGGSDSGNPIDLSDYKPDLQTGLFGLQEPDNYSFALTGPGSTNSPPISGVPNNTSGPVATAGPDPVGSPAPPLLDAQGNTPTTVLTGNEFVFGPINDVSFNLDVLADHPALTSAHHYLETALLGSDGSLIVLGDQDLASLPLQSNANPLGYASGWSTLTYDVDNTQLEPAVGYQPVFLFTNDLAGTGQAVEAVIDNVVIDQPTPSLVVSSPGVTPGNPVDLTSGSGTVTLTNTGTATLLVTGLTVTGSGATLPASQESEFAILPGDSVNVVVDRASSSTPVAADLSFETNDPNNSSVTIPLTASTAQATLLSSVSGSGTYGGTAALSATLTSNGSPIAGQLIAFSLQIGSSTTNLGTATTNSLGVATIPSASLSGINAATYQNAIQVSFAGTSGYAAATGASNLTIAQSTLTVTAVNQDIPHGGSLPTLTDTITGFIPGDSLSAVTGTALLATTASSTSPAGTYPISVNVSGLSATNYSFTAVPGTVTVHPKVTDVRVDYGSKSMSILNLSRDLPFSDITSIDILFSDNIAAPGSAITLIGQGGRYGLSATYNSTTFDETLKFPTALGIDRLTLALSNQIAAFSAPAATLNPFQLSFSVLPGDVNGDNSVDSLDLVAVRNGILGTLDQALIVWADIDGSGKIDINDYNIVKKFVGKRI